MQSPKRIRDELEFVSEFGTLLEVTQRVAVSHLSRLEERTALGPRLVETLTREFFPLLPSAVRTDALVQGGTRGQLFVMLTSDEGMVGPLHTHVVRRAQECSDQTTEWFMIGQRGLRLLGAQSQPVGSVPLPDEEEAPRLMAQLSERILETYRQRRWKRVWLFAPRFLSAVRQDVVSYQLLPLPVPMPADGIGLRQELVIEPSALRVLDAVATAWIEQVCMEAFWSSRRAEVAARALHVDASRQEIAKQAKRLRHEWFKGLHEQVDVDVRETCVAQRHVARRKARNGVVSHG